MATMALCITGAIWLKATSTRFSSKKVAMVVPVESTIVLRVLFGGVESWLGIDSNESVPAFAPRPAAPANGITIPDASRPPTMATTTNAASLLTMPASCTSQCASLFTMASGYGPRPLRPKS